MPEIVAEDLFVRLKFRILRNGFKDFQFIFTSLLYQNESVNI